MVLKMQYLLCCLSKSLKNKDGDVTKERVRTETEEELSEKLCTSCEGRGDDIKKTIDTGVFCRLDLYEPKSKHSLRDTGSLQILADVPRVSPNVVTPEHPVRVFMRGDGESVLKDKCRAEESTGPSNKSCEGVVANLLRRIVSKWSTRATEQSDFDVCDEKRQRKRWRQDCAPRGWGRTRNNSAETKFSQNCPLSEIPLASAEPSLPVICHKKTKACLKELDCGELKCGQGDAFRLPGHVIYGSPTPGQHLLKPQVLPVFSWSVPVFRTRLAEGGVSFTFGAGSEQAGTSETPQSEAQLPTTPILVSAPCTCSNPTPMEVDDPTPPEGSLLNHLVQLTNPSSIDPLQIMQQLRDDMQRQLDVQMQHQQQLIQQEVEARLRQMGASSSCDASPEHVMFCEWTLVLRYPSDRKVADRPMGSLGHELLRNYELKRRSSDNQHNADSNKRVDSEAEPKPHTEPVPVCPQPDPAKPEPAPVCPKTEPSPASSGSDVAGQPGTVKPEPVPESPEPGSGKACSQPLTRVDTGVANSQNDALKSEPVPGSKVENQDEREPLNHAEPQPEPSEGGACIRKSKTKTVTIKRENLGDDYDIF